MKKLIAILILVAVVALGYWFFNRQAPIIDMEPVVPVEQAGEGSFTTPAY